VTPRSSARSARVSPLSGLSPYLRSGRRAAAPAVGLSGRPSSSFSVLYARCHRPSGRGPYLGDLVQQPGEPAAPTRLHTAAAAMASMDLPRSRSALAPGRAGTPDHDRLWTTRARSRRRLHRARKQLYSAFTETAHDCSIFLFRASRCRFWPESALARAGLAADLVDKPRSCRARQSVVHLSVHVRPRRTLAICVFLPWSIRCSSTTSLYLADGFDCIGGDRSLHFRDTGLRWSRPARLRRTSLGRMSLAAMNTHRGTTQVASSECPSPVSRQTPSGTGSDSVVCCMVWPRNGAGAP